MRTTWLIAGKEFRSHLTSPMAYVVVGIFLLLTGFFFTSYLTTTSLGDTSIRGFVEQGALLLLLFSAALTMRLMAEEKKLGTWELLLTAPVRDTEVVLGKFLGTFGVLAIMLGLTLYYPLLLMIFGDPDIGPIITSYVGLFLLGGASLAIGIFASSLTSNQIVAAVVSGATLSGLWYLGLAAGYMGDFFGRIVTYISLSTYFPSFVDGVIDTRAVVYYLSITALFLYLTIRSLETSRWN